MQLFQIPPPPADLVCTPEPEALFKRDTLLASAASIQAAPVNQVENEVLTAVGNAIQKYIKDGKTTGMDLRRPYNAAADAIKRFEDDFLAPLLPHKDRLGRLASVYRTEQERKAEAERQARAAEIARLEAQERKAAEEARKSAEAGDPLKAILGDLIAAAARSATMAAITAPPPEAAKTAGQSFRPGDLCFECTDINALWAARPELCNPPTPKASAIKAVCSPEHPVPGLKLWLESKVNFKSR